MKLSSTSFDDGARIPARFAFAEHDPETRVRLAGNVSPHLEWADVPEGTKSFAIICHDYCAPSVGEDVNQADREVPEDLPRVDFFHWLEVDLPADARSVAEGEFSDGVTVGGKGRDAGSRGSRPGVNDYTGWFAEDADMKGTYYGYDGPAPPWNDSILHYYRFTVYALDVERLDVPDDYNGHYAREALEGHILGEASIEGSYTQNPRLL